MFAFIFNGRCLIEETLLTASCVEQLLNVRPLTAVGSDVSDLDYSTPNHSLSYSSFVYLFIEIVQTNDHSHRRVFGKAKSYTELIWRRWLMEYVPQLQTMSNWFCHSTVPILIDSLVWLVDSSSPKKKYPLVGRVVKLNTADDSIARSATIGTSRVIYTPTR